MASTATWDFNTNFSASIAGSDITAAGDATNVGVNTFTRTTLTYTTPVLQVAPQASTLTEAAAITNGCYFTITVTGTGTISRFQIKAAKGGSGTRGIAVRSSADSYAANIVSSGSIATVRPTLTAYDTGAISIALSGTVTFRIYVYAPTNASTLEIDDIIVTVDPAGGGSPVTYTYSGSGGLQSGGSAALAKVKAFLASGGLQTGGSAALAKVKSTRGTGGASFAGAASTSFLPAGSPTPNTYTYSGTGGLTYSGAALTLLQSATDETWIDIVPPASPFVAQDEASGTWTVIGPPTGTWN